MIGRFKSLLEEFHVAAPFLSKHSQNLFSPISARILTIGRVNRDSSEIKLKEIESSMLSETSKWNKNFTNIW